MSILTIFRRKKLKILFETKYYWFTRLESGVGATSFKEPSHKDVRGPWVGIMPLEG